MRILVTGSRSWEDRDRIKNHLLVHSGGVGTVLVHGACPVGADQIADEIASEWPWVIERHPADWIGPCRLECQPGHRRRNNFGGTYCPAAGHYRNQEMVDLGADVVLAFHRDHSRGTQDCITRARAAGLLVFLVEDR